MSALYFQPATDFPYNRGQIACRLFLKLACNFWVTLFEDWRFLLAPAASILPLILQTQGQGCAGFACSAQKDQRLQHRVPSPAHLSPGVPAQAAGSQPAWAALQPAGFRHSAALAGWTCQGRSVGFTPCLTSLVYLSLLECQGSELQHSFPPAHTQATAGRTAWLFCRERLNSGDPKLNSFCCNLGSSS